MPSRGYEPSFGDSLTKVVRDGRKKFIHERNVKNSIFYFILFYPCLLLITMASNTES